MKMKLHSLYMRVKHVGLKPRGVKTDCVMVKNTVEEIEKCGFDFTDKIGGLKIESNKYEFFRN